MSDFQRNRELLGVRLRELRRNAGITGVDLARQLGWVQSKVSRLECGRQTASRDDLVAWVRATDAHPDLVPDLLAMLTSIESDYAAWRREFRTGVRRKQLDFMRLEARVSAIRGLDTTVVPGLLQTADYARFRIAEQPDLHGVPEDVSAAVAARMRRQQVIYDHGKSFHFIVTESVLRNRLCPPAVLKGQLDRLMTATGLENVKFGVVPFAARLPVAPLNGFWIFDETLVTFETVAAEIHVRDPDEVALYARVFDQLTGVSVYGGDARRLIAAAFSDL